MSYKNITPEYIHFVKTFIIQKVLTAFYKNMEQSNYTNREIESLLMSYDIEFWNLMLDQCTNTLEYLYNIYTSWSEYDTIQEIKSGIFGEQIPIYKFESLVNKSNLPDEEFRAYRKQEKIKQIKNNIIYSVYNVLIENYGLKSLEFILNKNYQERYNQYIDIIPYFEYIALNNVDITLNDSYLEENEEKKLERAALIDIQKWIQ